MPEQPVLQHLSPHKLVADAVVEAAEYQRTTAVRVEELEHLHLPPAVHIQLCVPPVDPHQDAGLLQGAQEAARQPVGDALREHLDTVRERRVTVRRNTRTRDYQTDTQTHRP